MEGIEPRTMRELEQYLEALQATEEAERETEIAAPRDLWRPKEREKTRERKARDLFDKLQARRKGFYSK